MAYFEPYGCSLIFDWNQPTDAGKNIRPPFSVLDETLRDGLQSPSVREPSLGLKLDLLHQMNALGLGSVNIGMPGASPRAFASALRLVQEIADGRLAIVPGCAGRTLPEDIRPILEIAHRTGVAVEVDTFVGASPIRHWVEAWDLDVLIERAARAIELGVRAGLPVMFVTEDTTRTPPEVLARLFRVAVDQGASRLCLCDTVGQATPAGVRALLAFVRSELASLGANSIGLDWHGHNDRGLALANALTAADQGADRIHGTALGLGERVGNVPLELLLLHQFLEGTWSGPLPALIRYGETVARAVGWPIAASHPLLGRDAFRTATGIHAAAVRKARDRGSDWLADRVYSSVPASLFGRKQEIVVGPLSGTSNAAEVLRRLGIEPSPETIEVLLKTAKAADRILTDEDVRAALIVTKTTSG